MVALLENRPREIEQMLKTYRLKGRVRCVESVEIFEF